MRVDGAPYGAGGCCVGATETFEAQKVFKGAGCEEGRFAAIADKGLEGGIAGIETLKGKSEPKEGRASLLETSGAHAES